MASKRKEQLRKWLDNTPIEDAWLTMTYQQISDEVFDQQGKRISESTVYDLLPLVAADKLGIEPSDVLHQRQEYRKKARGWVISPQTIDMIREWRTQENPVEIIDIAYRVGLTPGRITQILTEHEIP